MGVDGKRFERLVLGSHAEWGNHFPPFVEFGEAVEMALLKQPENWHPLHPPEQWGAQLLEAVRSALRQTLIKARCSQELIGRVVLNTGLYVAVGTPVDYWHGTDAIVCCDLGEVAPFVTIDLKAGDDEEGDIIRENHVIITQDHFKKRVSKGKLRLENIAGVISDQLIDKLEEAGVLFIPRAFAASAT